MRKQITCDLGGCLVGIFYRKYCNACKHNIDSEQNE